MMLSSQEAAQLRLLQALDARGYDFVTITPESHRRVLDRPGIRSAVDLRGIFGWSLPFDETLIEPELAALMAAAGAVNECPAGRTSNLRVSRIRGLLFLHSAFPTESEDSVFLGPDSMRFVDFIIPELKKRSGIGRLVDIGAGAGVGGIVAASELPGAAVELADLNPRALSLARVNAAFAGVDVATVESDGLGAVAAGFDVAIANPPFIFEEDAPPYRRGGGMHGAELSFEWAMAAARKVSPGGCVLLYTGSAIVDGADALREALERRLAELNCTLAWREIDPDIFGEELEKPAYRDVERIAAVAAVIEKASDPFP